MVESEQSDYWCIVGNISRNIIYGDGPLEFKNGTNLFRGGSKVFIVGIYAGLMEQILVIGQHRNSRSFIKCVIPASAVTNLRVKLIYHPKVIQLRDNAKNEGVSLIESKDDAVALVDKINEYFVKENARRLTAKSL